MEKVILTKEQAVALKKWKEKGWPIDFFVISNASYSDVYKPLNSLSIEEFSKALYGDFEVFKNKKKIGDKVMMKEGDSENYKRYVLEVVGLGENIKVVDGKGWSAYYKCEELRLATPEEIYWLETLGREKVGDFREGDVFSGIDTSFFILNENDIEDARIWYKDGMLKGLYPAESFKHYPQEDK